MNKLGPKKWKWLEDQGCYLTEEKDAWGTSSVIYLDKNGVKIYVGLADLGERASDINFIYKHRLTDLNTAFPGSGCSPISIGFNEKEHAWYGWTHRGYGKFTIGYEMAEGSILDYGKYKAPFKCETLGDCKNLAIAMARALD